MRTGRRGYARARPRDRSSRRCHRGCRGLRHRPFRNEFIGEVRTVPGPCPGAAGLGDRFAAFALPQADVDKLMQDAGKGANATLSIDLEKQEITRPDGGVIKFDIDPFRKYCLLNGFDDIGLTLRQKTKIDDYEAERRRSMPWLDASKAA